MKNLLIVFLLLAAPLPSLAGDDVCRDIHEFASLVMSDRQANVPLVDVIGRLDGVRAGNEAEERVRNAYKLIALAAYDNPVGVYESQRSMYVREYAEASYSNCVRGMMANRQAGNTGAGRRGVSDGIEQ